VEQSFLGFPVFALKLIVFVVGGICDLSECFGKAFIKKYRQADSIYIDSLSKKDDTVIGINN
jgi:hypothetical protein